MNMQMLEFYANYRVKILIKGKIWFGLIRNKKNILKGCV